MEPILWHWQHSHALAMKGDEIADSPMRGDEIHGREPVEGNP